MAWMEFGAHPIEATTMIESGAPDRMRGLRRRPGVIIAVDCSQLVAPSPGALKKIRRIQIEIRAHGRGGDVANARGDGFADFGNRGAIRRSEIADDGIPDKTWRSAMIHFFPLGGEPSQADV